MNLSYTFMTEVPFTACTVLAGWFFLRAIQRGRSIDVALGSGFAAYGFLIRQFGLLLPAAYVCAMAVTWWRERKRPSVANLAALATPWVAAMVFLACWRATSTTHYSVPQPISIPPWDRTGMALRHAARTILYMGLFLMPLLSALLYDRLARQKTWRGFSKRRFAYTLVLVGALIGIAGGRMPLLTNMLRDLGVGPITIAGAYYKGRIWAPVAIGSWWWAVTLMCGIAAAVLVADCWARVFRPVCAVPWAMCRAKTVNARARLAPAWDYLRTNLRPLNWLARPARAVPAPAPASNASPEIVFLFVWGVLMLAASYNPWVPVYFDRYMLPAIPPLALFLSTTLAPRRTTLTIAACLCALFYAFSVVCLQDYLAWNTARWAAIEKLRTVYGVADEHIDGGYEFNGMYTSDEAMRRTGITDFNRQPALEQIFDIQYRVAFNPGYGYETVDRLPYFSWLGMKTREILILRKRPEASSAHTGT
jgi:hypothetical protein